MISTKPNGTLAWKKYDGKESLLRWVLYVFALVLFFICFQQIAQNTIWDFFYDAPAQFLNILGRMFPPRWAYISRLMLPLWDTLVIATLGTLLAIFIAFPLAFLAAKNTTVDRRLVRPLTILIMVTSRSISSLIWALILVTILGPGLLAGILAIAFRSVGFISKLLYEAIEEIDERQVEAVTATGASRWHVFWFAIIPQIFPAFISISIYRWDINIRESSVLGLVGAGGLGLYLQASIGSLAWNQVSVILALIFTSVIAAEFLTFRVRKLVLA